MSKFWGQEEDQTSLFQHERQLSYLNSNMVQEIISIAEGYNYSTSTFGSKRMQVTATMIFQQFSRVCNTVAEN
jgi:ABC-type maltose transport system permease subunit